MGFSPVFSRRFLLRAIAVTLIVLGSHDVSAATAQESQKAVLITGASTGLGRMTAETLAAKGYFVYAGARKAEDLEALDAIENIQSVRLDVTIQSEIDAAVQTVIDGNRGQGRGRGSEDRGGQPYRFGLSDLRRP